MEASKMANCLPQISEILVGAKHYYIVEEEEMSAAYRIVSEPVPTEWAAVRIHRDTHE